MNERSVFPDYQENLDMFTQEEKLAAKPFYHKNDGNSSKVAAINSLKFKSSQQHKLRSLLKEHNGRTSKQLEAISKGTINELNHSQIDRRVSEMKDAKTSHDIEIEKLKTQHKANIKIVRYASSKALDLRAEKIKSLELSLSEAQEIIDKANRASRVLIGSEYHNSPDVVIKELQTILMGFQDRMCSAIVAEKSVKRKLTEAQAEIRHLTLQNKRDIENLAEAEERGSRLTNHLEALIDVQNGPPLATYEEAWNDAMENAQELLNELTELPENPKPHKEPVFNLTPEMLEKNETHSDSCRVRLGSTWACNCYEKPTNEGGDE